MNKQAQQPKICEGLGQHEKFFQSTSMSLGY